MKKHLFVLLLILFPSIVYGATPTTVPTFHCIGITWTIGNGSSSNECLVEYKRAVDSVWSDGLDLWYDSDESQYRGSIVNLSPGTSYNIRLTLNDTSDTDTVTVSTLSETFATGATTYLPLTTSTRYTVSTSGSEGSYHLYTYDPANGSATIDTNRSSSNGGQNMYIDAHHVIIRGINFDDALNSAIVLSNNAHDVVIEECDIQGFSDGNQNASAPTWDGGISIGYSNGAIYNITVQRNRIHSPGDDCNSWCEPSAGTHPSDPGPYGIVMQEAGSRWIIRYNSIYTTNGNFFADAICNGESADTNHNQEIYGNFVADYWDDGIQLEGDVKNCRAWENYFHNYHHMIACATARDGPVYIWRNIGKHMDVGSWCSYNRGGMIKLSSSAPANNARKYIFNNTMLIDPSNIEPILGAGGDGGAGIGSGGNGLRRVISKNNILHMRNSSQPSIAGSCSEGCSFSNELYNGTISQSVTNGINNTPTYDPTPSYWNGGDTTGLAIFTLSSSSYGKDDGVVINNFTDNYEGAAPDIGAHEYGSDPMEFGVDAYTDVEPEPVEPESGVSEWGLHSIGDRVITTTESRAMLGTFDDTGTITELKQYASGAGTLRMGVYRGGALDDPSTASLLYDAGTTEVNGAAWYGFNIPGGVSVFAGDVITLAYKNESGVVVYDYAGTPPVSESICGDFQSNRGRHDNAQSTNPDVAFTDPYGAASGGFENYWYSMYAIYTPGEAEEVSPTISVVAGNATASECDPKAGTFVLTSDQSTSVTINFYYDGSATEDTDYTDGLSGSATFASGTQKTITITPLVDTDDGEGSETVRIWLIDGEDYDITTPITATVTIEDCPIPPPGRLIVKPSDMIGASVGSTNPVGALVGSN